MMMTHPVCINIPTYRQIEALGGQTADDTLTYIEAHTYLSLKKKQDNNKNNGREEQSNHDDGDQHGGIIFSRHSFLLFLLLFLAFFLPAALTSFSLQTHTHPPAPPPSQASSSYPTFYRHPSRSHTYIQNLSLCVQLLHLLGGYVLIGQAGLVGFIQVVLHLQASIIHRHKTRINERVNESGSRSILMNDAPPRQTREEEEETDRSSSSFE